jgi:hypothetical protein
LHAVVRALDTQGVLVIASAGNDNTSKPFYPAAFKEVVGVCSSTWYSKTKAAYSNFGTWVSLCAPGLHYVTRPVQPGGLASGTSFASPMVAGVLGQLLLDAPCVKPRRGLQALLRTADALTDPPHHLGAGLLNPKAAAHYLRMLYPCQASDGFLHRLLTWGRHVGTWLLTYAGLIVYFILSVFALPFLLAFVIDMQQRRMARRQQDAIHLAYSGSPTYRYQRLIAIKQRWQRTRKLRWHHQAELVAVLHALYVHGEPCWWCNSRETEPACVAPPTVENSGCHRCGLTVSELLSLD